VIIARAFEEAGLPENLLHIVPGGADVGAALCEDKNIAMVSFTGSPEIGSKVGEACGRNLKKVQLELGGKNAIIVMDDADIDVAASNCAWGAWMHQGQICMATGLMLAPAAMAEKLAEAMTTSRNPSANALRALLRMQWPRARRFMRAVRRTVRCSLRLCSLA